jgi:hypothetical protein
MNRLWYFLALVILAGCGSKPAVTEVPMVPISTDATSKILSGKNWVTTRTGVLSRFSEDGKPTYEWLDEMKEPDKFIIETLAEVATIQFKMVNDTLANVSGVKDVPTDQKYRVEAGGEEDMSSVVLKFNFEGPNPFGGDDKMMLTYSYPVLGVSAKALVLGTPRAVNDRSIVVMMEVK